MYHIPVLLEESVSWLDVCPGGVYVDATFGGGGHSGPILEKMGGKGRLFAFDQDADAEANASRPPFAGNASFTFIRSNFRYLKRQLRAEGVIPGSIDGVLADLGVSSHQFDTPSRGFSYRFDAPLDMRMNTSDGPTAADVLGTYTADQLQRVLGTLGEVRNARTVAQAIVRQRALRHPRTTGDLLALLDPLVRGDRMRYLAQVFQALRMEVNDELGALADFLSDAAAMLRTGGRLVVITYHSLEDRMVKNMMKSGDVGGVIRQDFYGNIERPLDMLTRKAITPPATEIDQNNRARSARLRAAVKK
jgi:16S rRNA (cytosine1402-N4)-methyltransferase